MLPTCNNLQYFLMIIIGKRNFMRIFHCVHIIEFTIASQNCLIKFDSFNAHCVISMRLIMDELIPLALSAIRLIWRDTNLIGSQIKLFYKNISVCLILALK